MANKKTFFIVSLVYIHPEEEKVYNVISVYKTKTSSLAVSKALKDFNHIEKEEGYIFQISNILEL